jgi:hypothetical protein
MVDECGRREVDDQLTLAGDGVEQSVELFGGERVAFADHGQGIVIREHSERRELFAVDQHRMQRGGISQGHRAQAPPIEGAEAGNPRSELAEWGFARDVGVAKRPTGNSPGPGDGQFVRAGASDSSSGSNR